MAFCSIAKSSHTVLDNAFFIRYHLKENGTTGIKVYDQAGNDVTDDFKWLTDFFKMMS